MSSVVQRDSGLMDAFARSDAVAKFFDLADHSQPFAGREARSIWDRSDFLCHAVTDPERTVLRSSAGFQSIRWQKSPRQGSFVHPVERASLAPGLSFFLFLGSYSRKLWIEIVCRFVLVQDNRVFGVSNVFFVIHTVHDQVGSDSVPKQVREGCDKPLQPPALRSSHLVLVQIDHSVHVPGEVDNVFPNLSPLRKSLIRRIGFED